MSEDANPTLSLRIAGKRALAEGIFAFELVRPDGGDLPEFTSDAHLQVRTPNGLLRKYSLSNDPAERNRYVIGVKREPDGRGGSASMADETKVGDEIAVAAPRNDFALVNSPPGYIFIAGGIGITPVMSMIRHLKSSGGRFKLYYSTRSPEVTAFRDELSAPEMHGQVTIHHDQGDPAQAFDFWLILEKPKGMHLYCCGPNPLMQAVRDMTGHWPMSAVHFEAFTEPERNQPDDRPFKVRLARSGDVIEVPVGVTILEALRAHGLDVPSSCESGTCGTCRTKLLEGEPDHRDLVLFEDEQADNIMVCVSRAKSDELAIDR